MTIILQIIGFHNCDGCARKVRIALRRIGVRLVELERERGHVTIASVENPKMIRYALERQLKKSVVVLSGDIVPANQNLNSLVSQLVPANLTLDLQGLGQAMLRLAQVYRGLDITNTNNIRINFIHRDAPLVVRSEPHGNIEYAPTWAASEPSAPPMYMADQAVYGYPLDYYGISTTRSHEHSNGRCTIM